MASESFTVTALPYSASPSEQFHVSLFISHHLVPDGSEGQLGEFKLTSEWTKRLANAHFSLRGGKGSQVVELPVTPLLDQLDPELWSRVFPASLPVRPWNAPNFTDTPWHSFPAHRMQAYALINHAAAMWSSPLAAPGVASNPLSSLLVRFQANMAGVRPSLLEIIEGQFDKTLTDKLRDLGGDGIVGHKAGGAELFRPLSTSQSLLQGMIDLQAARRYYQRPEDQQDEYKDYPKAGTLPKPIPRPAPDFHERVGWLGDLSPLLRKLGLIVDLHIDNLSLLDGLSWIQADLDVSSLPIRRWLPHRNHQPKTNCAVAGHSFTTVSATGDYSHGLLKLGDETRFTLLDLDPDASALKLEQYTRNLLRLSVLERNGDPVNSAPASLRATGFSIARIERPVQLQSHLKDAPAKLAALLAGNGAPLSLEQVRRGLRLEVWDDVSNQWHSLHQRLLSVILDGFGPVLTDVADKGFLQGASLSRSDSQPNADRYAHEVLAGWDGWSLSAPRPGKIIAGEGEPQDGQLLDKPPLENHPINPVISTSQVQPGSLPRLRYGRSYSFRAFAVDLAGNSSPAGTAPLLSTAEAVQLMQQRWTATAADATHIPGLRQGAVGGDRLRRRLKALRPQPGVGPRDNAGVRGIDPAGLVATKVPVLDRLIGARLVTLQQSRLPVGSIRANQVAFAFGAASATTTQLLERTDLQLGPGLAAEALVGLGLGATGSQLISLPRPFLRWDPVLEPAILPRWAYSEGESLQRLVIRSGVRQPSPGAQELEVSEPAAYLTELQSSHPDLTPSWQDTCQRHLAPAKTSQLSCELHGAFETAIGKAAPAEAVRRSLGIALLEAGSFLDARRADIDNPGSTLEQQGVTFHSTPTADKPEHDKPEDLPHGTPPSRGQYVAHDVDTVVLPYLPDPLAAGLSLTFPDAGKDHRLKGLFAVEGTTLRFLGDWPQLVPYRLVLESGRELGAEVDGNVLRVSLPPGEQLRLRLSSSLPKTSLELLGLWRSLPAAVRTNPVLREAAADGWFWWLTPASEVRLVHAVPRPLEVPRATLLMPFRQLGDTAIRLFGAVDVHGPSTERIDVEARWTEWADDPTKNEPESRSVMAAACGTSVDYQEDLVVLSGLQDTMVPLPDGSQLRLHAAVHEIGDTRHRTITYQVRASSRYREYFPPQLTATIDSISVLGPESTLDVPSSARPAKVVVRDVLPLFRWQECTEPGQPFGLRRIRRTGLRIYLERPWYSSGDGELLALLLAKDSNSALQGSVTRWGSDPVFFQQGPAQRGLLPLMDLLQLTGLDDRPEAGRPVGPPVRRALVDLPDNPQVWTLSYKPEFSKERGLWYVDVAIDPGTAFWPFVQLAIARHQPSSLEDLHLGPITQCDFAQLPPERTATISRTDETRVRIVVTGAVGVPDLPDAQAAVLGAAKPMHFYERLARTRKMVARLERFDASIGTDLAWQTLSSLELPILGIDGTVVSWAGEITLPIELPPRTPGRDGEWRVTLEEWELLPGDLEAGGSGGLQPRIVYADHLPL